MFHRDQFDFSSQIFRKGFKNNPQILLLVYVTPRASGPDAALMCCRVDLKSETGQLSFHRVKKNKHEKPAVSFNAPNVGIKLPDQP